MALKKVIKALGEKDFFEEISKKTNFIPPEMVQDVYYSMIKVISQELRAKGAVDLPALGYLVLHKHKERMSRNVHTGIIELLPEKNTVKFRPCLDFKKYFHLLG